MKALIYKDILTMKKEILLILFFLVTYSVLAALSDGTAVYSIMGALCGVVGMLPAYTFTYDEKNRFDSFAAATPLSKHTVVLSKYLLGLLGTIPLFGSMAILTLAARLPFSFQLILVVISCTLIFAFIQIPLHFLLGANKARIITMVLFFLIFFGFFSLLNYFPFDISQLDENSITMLAVPAAALVFALSYLLSYRFYLRKEY